MPFDPFWNWDLHLNRHWDNVNQFKLDIILRENEGILPTVLYPHLLVNQQAASEHLLYIMHVLEGKKIELAAFMVTERHKYFFCRRCLL